MQYFLLVKDQELYVESPGEVLLPYGYNCLATMLLRDMYQIYQFWKSVFQPHVLIFPWKHWSQ